MTTNIPALLALNAHIWDTAQPTHEDTTWADHAAELRAEDRAHEGAQREAHREDQRW